MQIWITGSLKIIMSKLLLGDHHLLGNNTRRVPGGTCHPDILSLLNWHHKLSAWLCCWWSCATSGCWKLAAFLLSRIWILNDFNTALPVPRLLLFRAMSILVDEKAEKIWCLGTANSFKINIITFALWAVKQILGPGVTAGWKNSGGGRVR